MAKADLILPQSDSGCGKVFYNDRRMADGHRIALEFWNRATGYIREGFRLAVYRCSRCGGFHIGQRRVRPVRVRRVLHESELELLTDHHERESLYREDRYGDEPPAQEPRRIAPG